MENQYVKQFPNMMVGKKIMYVHGFMSSAQSGTVKLIRQTFPSATVVARDVPLHPEEAVSMLHKMCEEEQPDLIIGTSMGGMYTEMLRGFDRILVNPAFEMGNTMREHDMMGKQTFQNPREDGVQEVIVTKQLVKEYRDITERCFADITPEERCRVWGLFGDKDDIVHTFDIFSQHYPNAAHFHGGHRMDDHSFLHGVVPVIRWIDDRQEKRQREIVYISIETLKDAYEKPRSSAQQAFEHLIEDYSVYIVAPAPTNNHAAIGETQQWVEQFLSTPAHDRLIFCNKRELLYGDFMISTDEMGDFWGTSIKFGTDEMKTWEDIMTYFSRLK